MRHSNLKNEMNTAVILAGGRSTRMGFDKQLIKVNDRYLIEILVCQLNQEFDEIVIISNDNSPYLSMSFPCKVRIEKDLVIGKGPLCGIYSGLHYSSSEYVFFMACDMPYVNLAYIQYLKQTLAAEIESDSSQEDTKKPLGIISKKGPWLEPFYGFYSRQLMTDILEHIQKNELRIISIFEKNRMVYVEEVESRKYSSDLQFFENLNTVDDIARYKASHAYRDRRR